MKFSSIALALALAATPALVVGVPAAEAKTMHKKKMMKKKMMMNDSTMSPTTSQGPTATSAPKTAIGAGK